MIELKTDEKLKIGEYLSIELIKGKNIEFFKDGVNIGTAKITNPEIFKNRKLKGVVREKVKNGYNISIVRFADLHRHSGYSLLDGASK